MIFIPAIIAGVAAIAKPVLVAAGVGAAVGAVTGAGTGAVVEVVQGVHEHGEINQAVLDDAARGALHGAKDGALFGGVFGPVGLAVGPIVAPVIGVIDDIAAPAIQFVDEVASPVIQVADDAVRPIFNKVGSVTHSVAMSADKVVYYTLKNAKNGASPAIRKLLPKSTYNVGYVYVFDDAAYSASKIGKSIHPKVRVGQVKSPSGIKPKIACTIPTYNMKALEDSLHAVYASQNLPNTGAGIEWFNLSSSQVKAICN